VGHYLLSFAYPLLRDGRRMASALDWVNRSPGGAGCVNGTGLAPDREALAALLGFDGVITNTRDAMWQTDGILELLGAVASAALTQDALAEDLEIWASSEFDFVSLGEAYTRASVLMPQKRNPYALSMIRGAAGVVTGQVAGFLALQKGPSARSDKLIFAYREIPPALDVSGRILRLTAGVVATLAFNEERMAEALAGGFSQATDLADHLMTACGLDYRTAYRVAGSAVKRAAADGRSGLSITVEDLAVASVERTGAPVVIDPVELTRILDPARIVATRTATGGAAAGPVAAMLDDVRAEAALVAAAARERAEAFAGAEAALRSQAATAGR
jgi:argininosuccinate lyase